MPFAPDIPFVVTMKKDRRKHMKKRFMGVAMLFGMIAVLLSVLSFQTMVAKAAASSSRISASSCGKWSVVSSPNQPNVSNGLSGVAAISTNDAWAVGTSGNQTSGAQTLIEYWNGTSWQIVTSPSPGSFYNSLYAASAVSASDVWAVGYDAASSGPTQALVEHWNGTQWSAVASPSPASVDNELFSVAAVSANDVWAVGFSASSTSQRALIEHWNGTKWSVVKSPSSGTNDALASVAAVSANNVWAVGSSNSVSQSLAEHWNGSKWSVVASPNPGSGGVFTGVSAVSTSNVWAVGYYTNSKSAIVTMTAQWNGTSWKVVKSANTGMHPSLWGVLAISAKDVWAFGSNGNTKVFDKTLAEQWNGTQWSIVKSPSPGTFSTQLVGASATSANDVWAVGHADNNTLIEHYC
jgi:hypothetical protein